jgi:hypothetical protein
MMCQLWESKNDGNCVCYCPRPKNHLMEGSIMLTQHFLAIQQLGCWGRCIEAAVWFLGCWGHHIEVTLCFSGCWERYIEVASRWPLCHVAYCCSAVHVSRPLNVKHPIYLIISRHTMLSCVPYCTDCGTGTFQVI